MFFVTTIILLFIVIVMLFGLRNFINCIMCNPFKYRFMIAKRGSNMGEWFITKNTSMYDSTYSCTAEIIPKKKFLYYFQHILKEVPATIVSAINIYERSNSSNKDDDNEKCKKICEMIMKDESSKYNIKNIELFLLVNKKSV